VEDLIEIFVEHDQEHSGHLSAWLKNKNEVSLESIRV